MSFGFSSEMLSKAATYALADFPVDLKFADGLAGQAQKVFTEMSNRYEAPTVQVPSLGFHGAKHEVGSGGIA